MPQTPPEWYLTTQELQRKNTLDLEIRKRRTRHADLMQKIRLPGGLNDEEKVELRKVIEEFNAFFEERKTLLEKNPLLPINVIRNDDVG